MSRTDFLNEIRTSIAYGPATLEYKGINLGLTMGNTTLNIIQYNLKHGECYDYGSNWGIDVVVCVKSVIAKIFLYVLSLQRRLKNNIVGEKVIISPLDKNVDTIILFKATLIKYHRTGVTFRGIFDFTRPIGERLFAIGTDIRT